LAVAAALPLAAAQTGAPSPAPRPAAAPVATPPDPATLLRSLDCMIQPHQVVQVGSPVAGVIERIDVDRGERVTRGQVLAQLAANVERAALAVARERSQQSGEVATAAGSRELAQRELLRANELQGQEFVSQAYLDKARAEAQVAGGRSTQAEERRRLAQREVELASAQLSQRTIRSPIDGVVVERYMSPGEYVEQKPVLRLASLDPLRVDVLVPGAAFGRVQPGDEGTVVPELIDRSPYKATVKSVDRVIDAASNTFRVRLELPNPGNKLPAGLRCKLALGGAVAPPAVPVAAVAAPLAPTKAEPAKAAPASAEPAKVAAAPLEPLKVVAVPAEPAKAAAATAPVPEPTKAAAAKTDTAFDDVLTAVEAWRQAWVARDLQGYQAAYVDGYLGDQPSPAKWLRQREERMRAARALDVQLSDIRVEPQSADRVHVIFRQAYRSEQLNANATKRLLMVSDQGRWRIREERTVGP
jgi:RND family efflux transporter MFP subunit